MAVYLLLPPVKDQTVSHWDSYWEWLLVGSLALFAVIGIVLWLVARRSNRT